MTKRPALVHIHEFLQDARGVFSAFTFISLLAGFTIVTAPLVCRLFAWQPLTKDETYSLVLIYVISALSDAMLGVFLNKLPGTINLNTDGGDAKLGLATGPEGTVEQSS